MHYLLLDEETMQEEKAVTPDAEAVAAHVKKLLFNPKAPELPPGLAAIPDVQAVHHYILALRKQLADYAKGDFTAEIEIRGVVAGMLKSIQANMRHLIWQMEQVKAGDLNQRVDFMGQFSSVFNNMVIQLDDALTALHQKEKELTSITSELQMEVEKRGAALSALQKSEEHFKYLAEHDPLTNLLNRRSFFAQAEVELARNTIMDHPSAVALMDVDHFKKFNDVYGHLNGDIALRHIAGIGCAALRTNDIMGRLGGEEFIFFFSKANLEQGMHAAERVRKLVEETPVDLDGQKVQVTASFGVVCIPPGMVKGGRNPDLMQQAVDLADQALYRAKGKGRNLVCVAEDGLDI